ncbi:MAG: sensor histidine kinase [Flavobacteriales bacterium]
MTVLYILAVYILLQVCWWGYMLTDVYTQLYDALGQLEGQSMNDIRSRKISMLVGEGSVFVVLLILGFWQIKRALKREFELARMEKTFLLSVTHELKTPIAAVKLSLETLKSRKLSEEQQAQILTDALRENNRLQFLSENILLATRLDQKQHHLQKETIDFSALILAEVNRFQLNTGRLESNIQSNLQLVGEPELLRALVSNLIENALKYSSSEEAVFVDAKHENNQIILSVADHGQGIAEKELPHIFEKFYRIGNEETRRHKGTGLGLYIVKSILKLHEGKIDVRSNQPQGTIFTVQLNAIL